jgi:hypothetical protein
VSEAKEEMPRLTLAPPIWLLREIWFWRGTAILLLLILLGVNVISFLEDERRDRERLANWAQIQHGIAMNAKGIDTAGANIVRLDDHLLACLTCHAHPDISKFLATPGSAQKR